jgi:hypothetical protein
MAEDFGNRASAPGRQLAGPTAMLFAVSAFVPATASLGFQSLATAGLAGLLLAMVREFRRAGETCLRRVPMTDRPSRRRP